MNRLTIGLAAVSAALLTVLPIQTALAEEEVAANVHTTDDGAKVSAKGVEQEDGKWVTPDGDPSYKILADGKTDWYAYSGFRRYHSECHVCHGPEGVGSTYAPALTKSLKTMSYTDFMGVVASGQQNVWAQNNSVMPALGDNKNVMCYLDDIYVYLKARSDGVLPRGRPKRGEEKPQEARDFEDECLEG